MITLMRTNRESPSSFEEDTGSPVCHSPLSKPGSQLPREAMPSSSPKPTRQSNRNCEIWILGALVFFCATTQFQMNATGMLPDANVKLELRMWKHELANQAARTPKRNETKVSTNTTNQKEGYSVLLAGVIKNVPGSHLRSHIPKLVRLGQQLGNFHILIYENDSRGDTRSTLKELLLDKPYATYIFEDRGSAGGSRTDNIANARNKILDVMEERFADDYDYMFMIDMDGVCGGKDMTKSYDANIFRYALQHSDEWDGVSFRFVPYWDLWAFRHEKWMPENQAGKDKSKNKVRNMDQMDTILETVPRKDFIPVLSAFMMLSIYKIKTISGIRYSGKGVHGEVDCEHAPFHARLREERDARIRLLPMVYCEGDPGYFPLEEQLAM